MARTRRLSRCDAQLAANGFYSPSQLLRDGARHGGRVVPVDVTISGWDSVLEKQVDGSVAVRLGLSLLKGMKDGAAERIEAARAVKQFFSVSDLARRAQLDRRDLQVLAAANALSSLAGNRREIVEFGGDEGKRFDFCFLQAHGRSPDVVVGLILAGTRGGAREPM